MINQESKKTIIKRTLQGTVVSNKMMKTIVVKVERLVAHPKYGKRYKVSKKYKVHDPANTYQIGDHVIFQACRPLSKDKRWRVIGLASKKVPLRQDYEGQAPLRQDYEGQANI